MPLTSMIRKDKDFQNIIKEHLPLKTDYISINTEYPAFSTKTKLVAPYTLSNPRDSITIGGAFDYMARFITAKQIRNTEHKVIDNIVAANGINTASLILNANKASKSDVLNTLKSAYDNSIMRISDYLEDETVKYDEIINDACYLAKLDGVYRGGSEPKDGFLSLLNNANNEIITDVEKMCDIFINVVIKYNIIKIDSTVVFNPEFGKLSEACWGADADIFIDGTIYDFKSSKELGYSWEDNAQIYTYYLLDCLNKILDYKTDGTTIGNYKINKIAFYKARTGVIESLDVTIIPKEKLLDTLIKLSNYFFRNYTYDDMVKLREQNAAIEKNLGKLKKQDVNLYNRYLSLYNDGCVKNEYYEKIHNNMTKDSITRWVEKLYS